MVFRRKKKYFDCFEVVVWEYGLIDSNRNSSRNSFAKWKWTDILQWRIFISSRRRKIPTVLKWSNHIWDGGKSLHECYLISSSCVWPFCLCVPQGSQPMPMETSRTTSWCCIHENETRTQSAELDKDNSERTMLRPQFTRYIYRTSRLLEMYGKMIWCALNLFGNVLFFVSSIPSSSPSFQLQRWGQRFSLFFVDFFSNKILFSRLTNLLAFASPCPSQVLNIISHPTVWKNNWNNDRVNELRRKSERAHRQEKERSEQETKSHLDKRDDL